MLYVNVAHVAHLTWNQNNFPWKGGGEAGEAILDSFPSSFGMPELLWLNEHVEDWMDVTQ